MSLDRPGRLVEVEWVDSTGSSTWHNPDDARALPGKMECRSVGYLTYETDEAIVLTMGTGGYGGWLDSMAIPRPCVVSLTYLDPVEIAALRGSE